MSLPLEGNASIWSLNLLELKSGVQKKGYRNENK
jgi:hypothetical protein